MNSKSWCLMVLLTLLVGFCVPRAAAQTTAFTYQGKLENGGVPANGLHDFRFRLYDALTGGTQVGAVQCIDNLSVAGGLFTATLDFGALFSTLAQRFIEIDVRADTGLNCSNTAGFQTLTPRRAITAAPLAIHAKSAFSLAAADGSPSEAVSVDINGNVGIGTTSPQAKLDIDSGDLVAGLPTNGWFLHTRSPFNGDFLQLTDTVAGVPQFGRGVTLNKAGNIGIGTTAPTAKLDVRGDIRLGSSGQLRATAGEENLRIVRGVCNVTVGGGSITTIVGAGFAPSIIAIGHFRITFDTPFSGPPAVTASAIAGNCDYIAAIAGVTSTTADIIITNDPCGSGRSWDGFHFIAVGPR